MWFSGSSCYFSWRSSTIRQDHHFATKTPGKQKRFPSGPEPKRVLSERLLWISCCFFSGHFLVDDARYFTVCGEVFWEPKKPKANCTVFQTSRIWCFFLPFPFPGFSQQLLGGFCFCSRVKTGAFQNFRP